MFTARERLGGARPNAFSSIGGARVGGVNATWPLAKLSATPDTLTIRVALLGSYEFATNQVSSIERYVLIPVLGWGIRVNHRVSEYPERVVFWCLGNPDTVLRGIRDAGFVPAGSATEVAPLRRGFAIRWSAIVVVVLVWNLLFFLDFGPPWAASPPPGPFVLLALGLVCVASVGTLSLSSFQRVALKPDRSIGEVRPHLRLLAFVTGFLLIVFSVLLATGTFHPAG